VDEMEETEINTNAHEVATKVVEKYFGNQTNMMVPKEKCDAPSSRQFESSCSG